MPVLLVIAAFSRHEEAMDWGRARLEETYGPIDLSSPVFVFDQTAYYEPEMGTELRKQLWAFRDLILPDCLPDVKRRTNELEEVCRHMGAYPEARPLNLDPGYLVLGKFLLAGVVRPEDRSVCTQPPRPSTPRGRWPIRGPRADRRA